MNTINTFTAVIKEVDDWWVGWIEEIPGVNCQEKSHQELIESLKITLKEALEFNKQEALNEAGYNYIEEKIAL
ncbi:MAG: type II toxin-antitoxin system HicB family antitoxin [Cyanobacteria bacterium]|nr:type II toxin-antitoxin system HicB family antitoxin [Cyanobacteria bacterium CG_2015-16_32_12]NCO79375.1 type II toxin-antitoxin system HicB family antitoxin [Cyanobacteria bacterium CG_2015-22_32_23]NCQ05465.1 type II toxin-antitoxin system HicB family antitoxin [Cyanobacteria bacterium CG_2015-09_32_10]NCQ41393.1 type II toxin-antitoxin system HicB family antitoxin [Cyanobacteria bacterium CG_2015-04_32_10]NCS85649.1 type II toxin-antitoxin system HicB family antitoxin [Cyanobacteria bact